MYKYSNKSKSQVNYFQNIQASSCSFNINEITAIERLTLASIASKLHFNQYSRIATKKELASEVYLSEKSIARASYSLNERSIIEVKHRIHLPSEYVFSRAIGWNQTQISCSSLNQVWQLKNSKINDSITLLVALELAARINHKRELFVYPNHRKLAESLMLSRRSILNATAKLNNKATGIFHVWRLNKLRFYKLKNTKKLSTGGTDVHRRGDTDAH